MPTPSAERIEGQPTENRDPVDFPLRVASIDVGSNAIRFLAAEFSGPERWTQLEYERVPVRLGHSAFLTGELTPSAMDRTVEAFRSFASHIERLGIRRVRAVATSAVRESRNGPELVQRLREASGIELRLISGSEEARLVWHAVRTKIDFGDAKWLLVDLGGGSVEVSLADQVGIMWSESHTMGSVRLLEELSGADDAPAHFANLLAEYAAKLRIPHASKHWTPVQVIATGGNIETLARMAGQPLPTGEPPCRPADSPQAADGTDPIYLVSRHRLEQAIDELARLSYSQRERVLAELTPRLAELARHAKESGIGL
ncbi:MAG: hypothetical protein R3266_03635, partial [Gemmatimonadota bacterium]|nr:hypothetical protein [Gemmatimonadota bacterium]